MFWYIIGFFTIPAIVVLVGVSLATALVAGVVNVVKSTMDSFDKESR